LANIVYIATSLDGFIATKDGNLDWLDEIPNPDRSDFGFTEFMSNIDALIMGRITFEKVLTFDFWPYDKPVFVLSNTLSEVPDNYINKATIIKGNLNELIHRLHIDGYESFYIDGGKTIHNFLKEDLIDELIITKIPVLLGDGIPLFSSLNRSIKFKHKKTEVYNDSLVKSHYIRDR